MNKNEIFSHFSSLLDSLIDDSCYFSTYFQEPWSLGETIYGSDTNFIPDSITMISGATRTCIIDDDYDWVVKFDVEEDLEGSPCAREYKTYQLARELGLDKYLCEVEYIGTYTKSYTFYRRDRIDNAFSWYDGDFDEFDAKFASHEDELGDLVTVEACIPLYAYRRAGRYSFAYDTDRFENSAKRIKSPLRKRNIVVAEAFIHDFGEEEYERFSSFATKENLNDLHTGNVGRIDGHFCLIDYAGYYDEFGSDEWED